jgi:hypothetical protein
MRGREVVDICIDPPTCVIGSPKVGRESYPYHLAGSVLIVGLAIQNTDSSDSTVAAILNHRPEIHTKQHVKWRAFEEGCLKPRATKMACGKLLDTAANFGRSRRGPRIW